MAQWNAYESDLSHLLRDYNVRSYHAKDWRQRKGDFKNWPQKRRAQFNSRFLQIADNNLPFGTAVVLPNRRYELIYKSQCPRKVRPDTRYGLAIRCSLWKSLVFVRDNKPEWPLNVLEEGHRNASDLRVFGDVRDVLRPQYKNMLGFIAFGDKKTCLPVAAADTLAYAVFRMQSGYVTHPTQPTTKAVVGPADPTLLRS